MINISNNTTVYFLCYPNLATGGTELLHQAASKLRELGIEACMLYIPSSGNPVPERFRQYNVPWTYDYIDDSLNVIIFPESCIGFSKEVDQCQKIIWWMSVDNFYNHASASDYARSGNWNKVLSASFKSLREQLRLRKPDIYTNRRINLHRDKELFNLHLYQSEYARSFLQTYNISNTHQLSDYLNDDYLAISFDRKAKRKNTILYNPNKGVEITQKVKELLPSADWYPLQGLTVDQMKQKMLESKIYIDMGNHPGKDRIPREAAMCGCIVITNKAGAASFHEDVPLDDEFKYDTNNHSGLRAVAQAISLNLEQFNSQIGKQHSYREIIISEKQQFISDITSIFSL